jgi:hypothetical protein
MSLPKEAIEQFKKIYKKLYKTELSDKEASYRANNLVGLYRAVYGNRGIPKEEDKEQNKD